MQVEYEYGHNVLQRMANLQERSLSTALSPPTNSQAEGGKRHPKCNEQSSPRGSWVYSCHCFYENQNWMAGPRQPSSHPQNRESFKYGPVTLQTRPKQKLLFQLLVVDASNKVKGRSGWSFRNARSCKEVCKAKKLCSLWENCSDCQIPCDLENFPCSNCQCAGASYETLRWSTVPLLWSSVSTKNSDKNGQKPSFGLGAERQKV